ncbi:MAG TPA: undecaprenyl-diphosphate phosphatase [Chitinophagales bacterium]|nr:undecaprenyl-diphosphate phosphatase [Chitinophagales bacterium]
MTTTEAVILAVVEGLTEFIPVSSTGHMILTEALLKMQRSPLANVYIINIQFGAILAVVFLYWRRFFQTLDFYYKLFVAFIPAAILGFLLDDYIDSLLSSVTTVAISLVAGGIVLIATDWIFKKQFEEAANDEDTELVRETDEFGVEHKKEALKKFSVSWLQAFIIGCYQCIAMIPGVSRSASTILGGLTQKLNIKRAAEFSFFLAVPTIFAASAYKLLKSYDDIKGTDIDFFLIGNVVSFVVGMIAIKFFIGLITRFGLKFFGIYRIIVGVLILVLPTMGYKLEIPGEPVVPTENTISYNTGKPALLPQHIAQLTHN